MEPLAQDSGRMPIGTRAMMEVHPAVTGVKEPGVTTPRAATIPRSSDKSWKDRKAWESNSWENNSWHDDGWKNQGWKDRTNKRKASNGASSWEWGPPLPTIDEGSAMKGTDFAGAGGGTSRMSMDFASGSHVCVICKKGYLHQSYLALFEDKSLGAFHNRSVWLASLTR